MKKLIQFVKPYAGIILVIFCVLMVQAYSELSLPSYTSDIVNVGIQLGGIDESVPEAISEESLNHILLFMDEKQGDKVRDAYEESKKDYDYDGKVMELKSSLSEEELEELGENMALPMMLVSGFNSDSDQAVEIETKIKDAMKEQMAVQMPDVDSMSIYELLDYMGTEGRAALVEQVEEQMSEMPTSIVEQSAKLYIQSAYDEIGIDTDQIRYQYIFRTGAKMLGLAGLSMLCAIIVGFMAARVGAGVSRGLRKGVFRKVVGYSNAEFDQFSTASLITRSTNDIQQIQMVIIMMLRMILYAPIMAAGGIFKVLNTNVDMMWILGLGVALIMVLVIVLFTVVMPKFRIVQKQVDGLNMVSREILTGLPVIRAFGREKHEEKRFDVANADLTRTNLFVNRAMTFMMPCMMLIMNGLAVLIMWNGGHSVNEGTMQVGDMMAFIQYSMQIIMSFLMLCMISIILPRAAVSAERVDEVLKSETSIHDPETIEKFEDDKRGVVEFDHVSFKYPGAEECVLEDITFTAKPGQTTAIIGSTGCGKSTLINLIPRFFDVTEGRILVGGKDIRTVAQKELRDKLGYVPQKGILFSGDIESNIMYGNQSGSEEEMKLAAQIAQATEFIDTKPDKYKGSIAQGGSNVSGGQKQRLSIARAVAKHPDIFLFDDSFSALDYKTDVALRQELKKHTGNSTVIIVAQRISTILHADQILVLDDGHIVGKGTHKELLENCEAYYQIAASQLSEKELGKEVQ